MSKSKILEFERPADFYYETAVKYLDSLNYIDALPFLRKAIDKDSGNIDYLLTYSEVMTEMGKYDESNAVLFDMLKNGKVHPECYFGLGCNFMGINDFEKAKQSFEKYLVLDEDGEFYDETLDFLQFIEEYNADSSYIIDADEQSDCEYASEGKKKLDDGEYKTAIALLSHVKNPGMLFARNNLSLSYFCDGQTDKAIETSLSVLENDENNIHALCNLALFYADSGNLFDLTRMLARIYEIKTDVPEELYKIAVTMCELKMHEKARKALEEYLSYRPYDENAVFLSAVAEYNTGKSDAAAERMVRLIKMDPADTVARYYLRYIRANHEKERNKDILEYAYRVPEKEAERRIRYINECFNKKESDIFEMWRGGEELEEMLLWGLDFCGIALKTQIAGLIAGFGDEKSEKILRRYLLKAEQPDEIKNRIFLLLHLHGAKEPYIARLSSGIVEVKVGIGDKRDKDGENE